MKSILKYRNDDDQTCSHKRGLYLYTTRIMYVVLFTLSFQRKPPELFNQKHILLFFYKYYSQNNNFNNGILIANIIIVIYIEFLRMI